MSYETGYKILLVAFTIPILLLIAVAYFGERKQK